MYSYEDEITTKYLKSQIELIIEFLQFNRVSLVENGKAQDHSCERINSYFIGQFENHYPHRKNIDLDSCDYEELFDCKVNALKELAKDITYPYTGHSDFHPPSYVIGDSTKDTDKFFRRISLLNKILPLEKNLYFESLPKVDKFNYSQIDKIGGIHDLLYICCELLLIALHNDTFLTYRDMEPECALFEKGINDALNYEGKFEMPFKIISRYNIDRFAHSSSYRWIIFEGKELLLTEDAAECVRLLHESHTSGKSWLTRLEISKGLGNYSDTFKVVDKFQKKMKPYYKDLVAVRSGSGTRVSHYALNLPSNRNK